MNKFSKILGLSIGLIFVCSGLVHADTAKFTPLNFDDPAISAPATTTSKTVSGVQAKGSDLLDPVQVTG